MLADLHVHTTASDGTSKPSEVVRMAEKLGLRAVAITDHDTMEGISEAEAEAERCGIEVLSGVELSTEHNGLEVHVLGYCIDPSNEVFCEYLRTFKSARYTRAEKMVSRLRDLGININFDSVLELAGTGSVGRAHIARALMNTGKISSMAEAFDKYIGFGKAAYVPRLKFSPEDMVQVVIRGGGVPVLAHPGITCGNDLIIYLIKHGLQGIEVYHPKHTRDMQQHYLALCRKYGLIATGGSDFHGSGVMGHGGLGEAVVEYETVSRLREQAHKNSVNLSNRDHNT